MLSMTTEQICTVTVAASSKSRPYSSQLDFMECVYDTLEIGGVGILDPWQRPNAGGLWIFEASNLMVKVERQTILSMQQWQFWDRPSSKSPCDSARLLYREGTLIKYCSAEESPTGTGKTLLKTQAADRGIPFKETIQCGITMTQNVVVITCLLVNNRPSVVTKDYLRTFQMWIWMRGHIPHTCRFMRGS